MMTAGLAKVQEGMRGNPGMEENVRLVSISVDPEYDTTTVLTEYADRFKATPDGWLFLTGAYDQIQALARDGFKLATLRAVSPEEPIIHDAHYVLVDGEGRIRGYYESGNPRALEDLFDDLRKLVREVTPKS